MTKQQRILALDAAACAAEDLVDVHPDLRAAISLLQDELDKHFDRQPKHESFDDFLAEQLSAVVALANNPQTFGAA